MNEIVQPAVGRIISSVGRLRQVTTDKPLMMRLRSSLMVKAEDLPEIVRKACHVVERLPDPQGAPAAVVGLMLGRIQAGKTNAMITTAALAVDNGYKVVVVLTSDNTWLYGQTLTRFRQALRGLTCVGMDEWAGKQSQIKSGLAHGGVVLVATKNRARLEKLIKLLQDIQANDFPALIFDDEADQASLNTNVQAPDKGPSPINGLITGLRNSFHISGFIEVTATPQALLLLDAHSEYRPQFITVLEPGSDYIGGDLYFGPDSRYLVPVPLDEVAGLKGKQATSRLPYGLRLALCTFLVGAASRLLNSVESTHSLLVHVSLKTVHHERLRDLIQEYVDEMAGLLRSSGSLAAQAGLRIELQGAYDDLQRTGDLRPLEEILGILTEFISSTDVQVLNSENEQNQPRYDSAFNILIGGTKLGRGVTIKGLLVTYYGRESKNPQMDTVQQHARMYGYRKSDLPLSRIFLPKELAAHFRNINVSENELREWLASLPNASIYPLVIAAGMKTTRSNVVNATTVGCYVPGRSYTPGTSAFVQFSNDALTQALDSLLGVPKRGEWTHRTTTVAEILEILSQIETGVAAAGRWDDSRIRAALDVLASLYDNSAHLVVFAGRNLSPNEKPNVADSDDLDRVPANLPTLFMFRQEGTAKGLKGIPFWIPVVRFPEGQYPVGFNFS